MKNDIPAWLTSPSITQIDVGAVKQHYAWQYKIVEGKRNVVEHEVIELLQDGWNCQGGVSMHQDWFCQAMIKFSFNEPNKH